MNTKAESDGVTRTRGNLIEGKRRIVAMISKGYVDGEPCLEGANLAELFEHVCWVNQQRGFDLESWHFTAVTANNRENAVCSNDTIVAVFRVLE